MDVIIIQQPSELPPDLTSITSVIKPLLSFQVASKHLEALLHIVCISAFCRQATGTTATVQASHWQMMNFAQAPQELLALRACAFCWAATLLVVEWLPLALEGNSSSHSSRHSHPMWSSNTHSPSLEQGTYQPVSVSSHPPLIPPPHRATSQACLTGCHKTSKQKLQHAYFRQAGTSTKAEANTTEFELKWLQMHIFNFAKKNHLNDLHTKLYILYFITEIILSI